MDELDLNLDQESVDTESDFQSERMKQTNRAVITNSVGQDRLTKAARIHEGLLFIQRRNRKIRLETPFKVAAFDSILLTYLSHNSELSASELILDWGLSKSTVSRIFASFIGDGFLVEDRTLADKRQKRYLFTARGLQLVKELDSYNSSLILRSSEALSGNERKLLASFFHRLNNGLGITSETLRPSEEPLINELFRTSRGTGLLGSNYMNSGWDLDLFQLMFELYRSKEIEDFAEINRNIPISASKISRTFSELEKAGLVLKSVAEHDKRKTFFRLTPKGLKQFQDKHQQIAEEYAAALTDFTDKEVNDFIALQRKFTETTLSEKPDEPLTAQMVGNELQRKRARAFLVERLVAENRHHELESEIIPDSSLCAVLQSGDEIRALIELRPISVDHYQLKYLLALSDLSHDEAMLTVIKRLMNKLRSKHRFRRLTLREGFSESLRKALLD